MSKIKSWYIYAGVGIVGVLAFVLTEPEKPKPREKSATTARSSARGVKEEMFTAEDYQAKFTRVASMPNDAFAPLVLSGSGSDRGSRLAPNEIPVSYTGGKERWTYTGTAVVDGIPQALVENAETGEGEFLKVGQVWKNSVVRKITPVSLMLEGPNLEARTFELMKDPVDESGNLIAPSVRPVNPAVPSNMMQGSIGGAQPAAQGGSFGSVTGGAPTGGGGGGGRGGRRGGGQPAGAVGFAPAFGGSAAPSGGSSGTTSVEIGVPVQSTGRLGGFIPDDTLTNSNPGDQ